MDESVWDISFIWDYGDDNYFGKSGTCVSPKGMRTKPLARDRRSSIKMALVRLVNNNNNDYIIGNIEDWLNFFTLD